MLGGLDLKDWLQLLLSLLALATAAAAWLRKPGEDAQSEVHGLKERMIALEERTKYMPDSEELAKLEGMVKQIDERTAGLIEAIDTIRTSQRRVEDYLLRARTRTMMRFDEFQTQDRRLVLLKGLENAAQYKANGYLLRRYCEAVGHVVSADQLATDVAWLAEQGLVTQETTQGVLVATLTARGLDVATGRAHAPGVARPQPGA